MAPVDLILGILAVMVAWVVLNRPGMSFSLFRERLRCEPDAGLGRCVVTAGFPAGLQVAVRDPGW
ncbi:MAG: hypothetical protein KQH83_11780 [Actinobacteria bacterium]|nr:hypothetical protein [Actinomycetota bacterium]